MEMPTQNSLSMGSILSVWWPDHNNRVKPGPKFRPVIYLGECVVDGVRHWVVAYGTSQYQQRKESHNGGDMMVTVSDDVGVSLQVDTRFDFNDIQAIPANTLYFSANKKSLDFKTCDLPGHLTAQAVQCMQNANVARKLKSLGVKF